MRIGRKIAFGYASVIALTLVVGAISVMSMRTAQSGMEQLDSAYLPAMKSGGAVERNAWALFFHMRSYGATYDAGELRAARAKFDDVSRNLREGAELADTHALEEFGELGAKTTGTVERYGQLMNDSEKAINTMVNQRKPLNAAQARFGQSCDQFLKDQSANLAEGVRLRQEAIVHAQNIVSHGTQARVLSFEAQSSNNYGLFDQAKAELAEVYRLADLLAASATSDEERSNIEKIRSAAKNYDSAIGEYYEQVSDEEDIDVMAMMNSRKAMEDSAAQFSVATENFLNLENETLKESVAKRLGLVNEAATVLGKGNEISVDNLRAQAEREQSLLSGALKKFESVYAGISSLRAKVDDKASLANLGNIESAAKDYESAMRSYLEAWKSLDRAQTEVDRSYQEVLKNAQEMAEVGMTKATASSHDNASGLATGTTMTLLVMIGAIAMAACVAFFGVRSITGALRRLVGQLNTSAGSVSSASGQVSRASQELAEGSSQQAASVEETSSSLEELASMTRQNAEHATTANQTVQSTAAVVAEATQAMNELTSSMEQIASGSKETQKIIKTIDEIAFQTNLLALNAAVEAARAGEAGAGFAVVADEVRNLAIRAAEAARNTAGLIEGSVKKIDVGSALLSRTNEAFTRVSSQTNQVRDLISNIATASGEQSNGIEQINKAVSEMDRVVQRNASGAEETASAASELSSQAVALDRVVEQLNALLDGDHRGLSEVSAAPVGEADSYGEGDFDEDEFSFNETGGSIGSGKVSSPSPSKVSTGSSAASSQATHGVIRDSEMSHDDFDFDDTDFNFDDDDSFDSPKR